MDEFAEECWVLRGVGFYPLMWVWRERYISKGSMGSVDFDWEKAWDDKLLVGWRHTHPGTKFDFPSSMDDRTMMSWVKATGRSMVCGVTCRESTRYYLYTKSSGGAEHIEISWTRLAVLGATVAEMRR
jgi:hypothetical protein